MNRLTNTQFTTLNEAWQTIRDIKEAAIEYQQTVAGDTSDEEAVRTLADDALNQLWALARQLGSTLPAAEPERTWTFTISANFTATTEDDARDEWYDWLNSFNHIAEGTQVTENLPAPTWHVNGSGDIIDDAAIAGQDRESYTDDQDRESYTVLDDNDSTNLIVEFIEAARMAVKRYPLDYEAALRYARALVSEEGE